MTPNPREGFLSPNSPESSSVEPLITQVRKRWDAIFSPEQLSPGDIQFLPTGIGGAPECNRDVFIRTFPDGSQIPPFVNLQEIFGAVPHVLTLIASPLLGENVLALHALAREYKKQGVRRIIVQMTALAHERQDHPFKDAQGTPIQEALTLETVASLFASPYSRSLDNGTRQKESTIDAGMIIQPHSEEFARMALEYAIPILSFDAFDFLADAAVIANIENAFMLGPDKGRRLFGRIMAERLGFPFGSASKVRNRRGNGHPTVEIPQKVLNIIQENNAKVIIMDDEIRNGGTTGELVKALVGYASEVIICATKGIFSGDAAENLDHPIISRIVLTDAVRPLTDISRLKRIQWVSLQPGLDVLNTYLQTNLSCPGNPNWLTPTETGTLLRLQE